MKCALVSFWNDVDSILPELANFDKIFACEQAAYDLLTKGIQLEKIISDFDTIDEAKIRALQANIVSLPSRKDETDTVALFNYILEQHPTCDLTVYNEFAGRIDHALAMLSLFDVKPDLKLKTPKTEIYYKLPGTYIIEQHKEYHYISFIALENVVNIELINFQYPLNKSLLNSFSDLTVSNEFLDDTDGVLKFVKGKILVIYSRD